MRNLRKLTAVVLTVALVLTSMTAVFAADSATLANADKAATLKDLGLYSGQDANDPKVGLENTLTTQDSLIFLAKLFGYYGDATKLTADQVTEALAKFDDAASISDYAKKVVAYSATKSILNGSTKDDKFFVGAKDTVTAARFATFMLKQMGYGVTDYKESVAKLAETKGNKIDATITGDLTRDAAVGMMYAALSAEKASGKTVITDIVGDDAELMAKAQELGFATNSAKQLANADKAATLKDLGLYVGQDANDPKVGLENALATQDSLILLAKLFGYYDATTQLTADQVTEALAKFEDAASISDYAKKVVAYSATNNILSGSTQDGKFFVGAKDTVTAARFATFMLKQMGYVVTDYKLSVAKLAETKKSKIDATITGDLTRDLAVGMMYAALTAEKASGKTVIDDIVGDHVDLKALAEKAGLLRPIQDQNIDSSDSDSNEVGNQSAPTGLAGVAPSAALNDGKITGTTIAMEYKLATAEDSAYIACSDTETVVAAAGYYVVRLAAKTGFNSGATATVTVPAYITPDTSTPVITAGAIYRTSDIEGTIKFTSNEAGSYYYSIVDDGSVEPTVDTSGVGTVCTTAETTITNPTGLTAGAKDIYIIVKDAAGNVSNALKIDIAEYVAPDTTAPDVTSCVILEIPDQYIQYILIEFDEELDEEVANNPNSYAIIRISDNQETIIPFSVRDDDSITSVELQFTEAQLTEAQLTEAEFTESQFTEEDANAEYLLLIISCQDAYGNMASYEYSLTLDYPNPE